MRNESKRETANPYTEMLEQSEQSSNRKFRDYSLFRFEIIILYLILARNEHFSIFNSLRLKLKWPIRTKMLEQCDQIPNTNYPIGNVEIIPFLDLKLSF